MKKTYSFVPLQLAFLYAVVAALWIYASDRILASFVTDPSLLRVLEVYKGWFFVVVTAMLLFFALRQRVTVTERAEKELSTSEEKYSKVFMSIPAGISLSTLHEGRYVEVNKEFEKIFGYTHDELVGQTSFELGLWIDPNDRKDIMQAVTRGNVLRDYDLRIYNKNRDTLALRASFEIITIDGQEYLLSAFVDITERKKAENKIHESEELYKALVDNATEALLVMDMVSGKFVGVSESAVELFGLSKEELLKKTPADISPEFQPDGRLSSEKAMEKLNEAVAGAKPFFEWTHKHSSGSLIPCELRLVRLPSETQVLVRGSIVDITERKKTEEEKERARYMLGERVKELTALHHISRLLQTERPLDKELFSEIVALLPPAWQYPEHCEARIMYSDIEALTAGWRETEWKQSAAFSTGDGRRGTVEVVYLKPQPVAEEGPFLIEERNLIQSFAHMLEAYAERRRIEDAIKESEERYRELIESARDAIFTLSTRGDFTSLNSAFETILGWSRNDWIGKPFIDIVHTDDARKAIEIFQRLIRGESVPLFELRIRMKSGSYAVGEFFSAPRIKNGEVVNVLGVTRDITQRKNLEEQIRRTQRLESLGTLAGGIAHDLNNILAPILMSIDVMQRRVTQPELQQKMLVSMGNSATRGKEIVKQILAFARGTEKETAPQQLRYVVQEIESIIKQTFAKNISIRTNVPKELYTVLGDSTQLHQVVMNLCVNARDAMPDGGDILIAASNIAITEKNSKEGETEIPPGDYVLLSISDTGTGIPKGIQEKIFEPFFTTKEIGKGTGLGLSTVYGIIKDHNGFLELNSEVGKGTEFRIYFPAIHGESESIQNNSSVISQKGNGEVILVVDDEFSILHIAKETLEAYGYNVITAGDGSEAAALFSGFTKGHVSLILTDIDMPKMNGPEAIKIIRGLDPAVKVILTSGMLGDMQSEKERGMNIQGRLTKPYTSQQLLRLINDILHQPAGTV